MTERKRRLTKAQRERLAALEAERVRKARKSAKRGRAMAREAFASRLTAGVDTAALTEALRRYDEAAAAAPQRTRSRSARAAPSGDAKRWVPIGPSVVRKGQGADEPRVSGRIRDIAVDATGTRAYAASAMGGVWYTEDGGATWSPFGGWAERARVRGGAGNGQSIGCLLVTFGADQAHDIVLAGTGETKPVEDVTGDANAGVGVLVAKNIAPGALDPWEADSGLAQLEGTGIYRLVRKPGTTPGKASGADADVVLACTSKGAFIGTRTTVAAGGNPPVERFDWVALGGLAANIAKRPVTDASWPADGRVLLAVSSWGPVWCDGRGGAATDVMLDTAANVIIEGAQSFGASSVNPHRVYVLGEVPGTPKVPTVWQIPDVTANPPAMTVVSGTPATLWGTQRDYDQAIAVDSVAGKDRVYLGGSAIQPKNTDDYGACLYCFDVTAGPAPSLIPAEGVSRPGLATSPTTGEGADQPGLIGNNVHADVHAIVLTGADPERRQVWVGTDGGVFVSDRGGRVFTFASVNTGLATLQPVFVRSHPVNGHTVAAGFQDNGTQLRTGDTVWEEVFKADGGGLAFHPRFPHVLVRQYNAAAWYCTSSPDFLDPMLRSRGQPSDQALIGAEDTNALFYSSASVVADPEGAAPTRARLALGTTRVWITDDLGTGGANNSWLTLPWPGGAPTDGRPGGAPSAADLKVGVPTPAMGSVVTLAWVSYTELLVVYTGGVVRYTEDRPGHWTLKVWRLTSPLVAVSRKTMLTEIAPVPTTQDFYLTATGLDGSPEETVWFYNHANDIFHRTDFRHVLDIPGNPATLGPRDPVFSVVVDPADTKFVYVGTATGVWKGERKSQDGPHKWDRFDAGLPQATVQDLTVWVDRKARPDAPRLLRAGVQSRGVWEVDLAHDATRVTWIRAHRFDHRRMPLASDVDPMTVGAGARPLYASPDIVVRPSWPVTSVPKFPGTTLSAGGAPSAYHVWTFQTAFRWLYPSIAATGVFTEALGSLVSFHRKARMGKTAVPEIDQEVWEDVVGKQGTPALGVRVSDAGVVTYRPSTVTDSLAVYRSPWQTPRAAHAAPTEIDALELVTPVQKVADLWTVYREPCTVEVIAHHRDSRPLAADDAYVVLMWRHATDVNTLMGLPSPLVCDYLTGVATTATPPAPPQNWNVVTSYLGDPKRSINVGFDARLPRGRSIDVNLTSVPAGHHVLLLAFVRSAQDDALQPPAPLDPVKPLQTIAELILSWPHVAARVVKVANRPAP